MLSFIRELWKFIRVRKKFWLIPVLVIMALLGGLVVLTKGSAIAPFIYTFFLSSGYDATVLDQSSCAVMIEGGNPENSHAD